MAGGVFLDASVLRGNNIEETVRYNIQHNNILFEFPEGFTQLRLIEECRALNCLDVSDPDNFDMIYDITMQMLVGKTVFIYFVDEKDEIDLITNDCAKTGSVIELIISKESRGTGIGRALLNKIETYFSSIGCKRINIEVFGPNKSAYNFYSKNGYADRDYIVSKSKLKIAFNEEITDDKLEQNDIFKIMLYDDTNYRIYKLVVTNYSLLNINYLEDNNNKQTRIPVELILFDNHMYLFEEYMALLFPFLSIYQNQYFQKIFSLLFFPHFSFFLFLFYLIKFQSLLLILLLFHLYES